MANLQLENDLKTITRDACSSVANQGDSQAAGRLTLDVTNFIHSHASAADRQVLLKTLHSAGVPDDQIAKLDKLGFPTPTISDARNTNQEVRTAAQNSTSGEQHKPPMTARDVLAEVKQAEGSFNRTASGEGAEAAQKALRTALHDVEDFCKNNPEQAKEMIRELAKAGQLPQLAVAKLDERTGHLSYSDSLTRGQAVSLLNDGTPLGKGLAAAMDSSFSPIQKDGTTASGYYGGGFADNTDRRTKEPTISMYHLRQDLMTHFDSAPVKPDEGESLWDRIVHLFS